MKLIMLNKENILDIERKRIYIYEKNESYFRELYQKYPCIFENIVGIIDTSLRNLGQYRFGQYSWDVTDMNCLNDFNSDTDVILICSDYFDESFDYIKNKIYEVNEIDHLENFKIYFFSNRETDIDLSYRQYYASYSLDNIILFRSGPHAASYINGMDFSDNARALFEYMLSNHYNDKYELVWLVKNPDDFTQPAGKYYRYTRDYRNVSFIGYDWADSEDMDKRDEYYRVLCLAKYIFFTDAYGFARNSRKDQVRVQLWHGCGFKTRVNFVRCEKRYEYTTVISDLYSDIHREIYGLNENQMLVTGYAKQDWLFDKSDDYMTRLELPAADKYIFWLPTFRMAKSGLENLNEYEYQNQTGLPIVNTLERCKELNLYLKERNIVLLVKLHPFQDKTKIMNFELSNMVMIDNDTLFDSDIQINQLLGCADALISDYSSAAVDYMLLDRPIAFTLDDVEEYRDSRGFVFDNILEWLPGDELYNFEDFCGFIDRVYRGEDDKAEKRRRLTGIMHKFHDNESCRRIVEALKI